MESTELIEPEKLKAVERIFKEGKKYIFTNKYSEFYNTIAKQVSKSSNNEYVYDKVVKCMAKLDQTNNYNEVENIIKQIDGPSAVYVRNIIVKFAKKGPEFLEATEPSVLSKGENREYIEMLKKENEQIQDNQKPLEEAEAEVETLRSKYEETYAKYQTSKDERAQEQQELSNLDLNAKLDYVSSKTKASKSESFKLNDMQEYFGNVKELKEKGDKEDKENFVRAYESNRIVADCLEGFLPKENSLQELIKINPKTTKVSAEQYFNQLASKIEEAKKRESENKLEAAELQSQF